LDLIDRRGALGRGHAFDDYAFPTFGLPRYTAIVPDVEPAVVYSIARGFNAKAVSSAHALGLGDTRCRPLHRPEVQRRL
jgi:soluble lytic murein transglycosylase